MAAYWLKNGRIREYTGGTDILQPLENRIHLTADGEIKKAGKEAELLPGEGLFAYGGGFYGETLEIQTEFLKTRDAKDWLRRMLLRHMERVRHIDNELLVFAEIMEDKA